MAFKSFRTGTTAAALLLTGSLIGWTASKSSTTTAVAAPAPAVVAVVYEAKGDALAQARRSYDGVVRKPGRARAVVDVVDDALFARALRPAAAKAVS